MVQILQLPNFFINLECVQLIEWNPEELIASILWKPGYEETILKGENALCLIAVLEQIAIHVPYFSVASNSNLDKSTGDLLDSD